jgi:hypothetical protein
MMFFFFTSLTNMVIVTFGLSLVCVSAIETPQPHPDLVHDLESHSTPNLRRFLSNVVSSGETSAGSIPPSCPVCTPVAENNQQGNIVSKVMNGLYKAFQGNQNGGIFNVLDDVVVPVEMILPILLNASDQFVSVADKIRQDNFIYVNNTITSDTNTTESELSFRSSMSDFSASNMESVSTLLDVMIAELSSRDTIRLTSLSCGLVLMSGFINNNVMPNIASIADSIVTVTGMSQNGESYNTAVTNAISDGESNHETLLNFTDTLLASCLAEDSDMSATMSNTTSSLKVGLDKKRRAYLNRTETFQASADYFQNSWSILLLILLKPFILVYFAVSRFITTFLTKDSLSSFGGPIRYLVNAVLYIILAIVLFPITVIFLEIILILAFILAAFGLGAFAPRSGVEATEFDNEKFRTMEALATQFQGMNDNIVNYQTNNVVMSKDDLECSLQALSCEMNL